MLPPRKIEIVNDIAALNCQDINEGFLEAPFQYKYANSAKDIGETILLINTGAKERNQCTKLISSTSSSRETTLSAQSLAMVTRLDFVTGNSYSR